MGEWRLRLILRKWRVTVPTLVDDKAIMGGPEMVAHAQERMGAAAPKLLRQGVDEWLEVADDVMNNERCVKGCHSCCSCPTTTEPLNYCTLA